MEVPEIRRARACLEKAKLIRDDADATLKGLVISFPDGTVSYSQCQAQKLALDLAVQDVIICQCNLEVAQAIDWASFHAK